MLKLSYQSNKGNHAFDYLFAYQNINYISTYYLQLLTHNIELK